MLHEGLVRWLHGARRGGFAGALLAALAAVSACGVDGSDAAVGARQEAIYHTVGVPGDTFAPPWMAGDGEHHPVVFVFAEKPNGQPSYCSGVFVSPYHVLTAAHCFPKLSQRAGDNPGPHQMVVGVQNPNGPATVKEYYGCDVQTHQCTGIRKHGGEWLWLHPRYDLALLQVAGPYEGPTIPIRWDAPREEAIPPWYGGTWLRFSGYGDWPDESTTGFRTYGRGTLGEQSTHSQAGPVFGVNAGPSSGCQGDSGGPVYVLRGARHKDGYGADGNALALASLIGVLVTGSCTEGEGSNAAYLDKAWIDGIVCGGPDWEMIHGASQLEEAASRQRLLKIGRSTGPNLIPGTDPPISSLEEGQLPRRDKGIVCAYVPPNGQPWFGMQNEIGVPTGPSENVALLYGKSGPDSTSIFFWNPLVGPEYAGSFNSTAMPLRVAAASYNLFAVGALRSGGARGALTTSYDLDAPSCPSYFSPLVGGHGVEGCVDGQVLSSAALAGLYPSHFDVWPPSSPNAGGYRVDTGPREGWWLFAFRDTSGGSSHEDRLIDYAAGYLLGYYLSDTGRLYLAVNAELHHVIKTDSNILGIAASSTTAFDDMLFALLSSGSSRYVARVNRNTGSYTTIPLPAGAAPIEQIVGRPSDSTAGLLYLRDADGEIFRGVCNPSSEACSWTSIGTGDVIRGDWAVGRAPAP